MDNHESLNAKELCWVLNMTIPPQFKVLNFEKYDGTKCLKTHLIIYYNKMIAFAYDEKLLIHFFQHNLMGAITKWYFKLDKNHICTWRDWLKHFWVVHAYAGNSS